MFEGSNDRNLKANCRTERLFASRDWEHALAQCGLGNLAEMYASGEPIYDRHVGREVRAVCFLDPQGRTTTGFLKLNWGRRRLWPQWNDFRVGQAFDTYPLREWKGIGRLARLGIDVPERLALLQQGWIWQRAAILVKAVPPVATLHDWIGSTRWKLLPVDERREMIEAAVEVLRKIHRGGFIWRGVSVRHMFPERGEAGSMRHWLIDCEGVVPGRSFWLRRKNFLKLRRSLVRDAAADALTVRQFDACLEARRKTISAPVSTRPTPPLPLVQETV